MSISYTVPQTVLPTDVTTRRRHLYGPVADFMLLGGGSLLVMAAIAIWLPKSLEAQLGLTMLLLANLINHPHFAHSYQIFYSDFRAKAFGNYSTALRSRYVFAGIVAPILLAAYFSICLALGLNRALALAINIMAFFSGWHYVKQGYGMLMLDSALKQRFFHTAEKRIFLLNAYVGWAFTWLLANQTIRESELWGLKTYTFAVPATLLAIAGSAAAFTLAGVAVLILRRVRMGAMVPWNGIIAYAVSIYSWLLVGRVSFAAFLLVPAFHSLQYLAVVWRYQLNREKADAIVDGEIAEDTAGTLTSQSEKLRFATFTIKGVLLGIVGFWALPLIFGRFVPYDHDALGANVFIAIFWIFINVHHYFLDNVMWRRENTDMKKYLFGR